MLVATVQHAMPALAMVFAVIESNILAFHDCKHDVEHGMGYPYDFTFRPHLLPSFFLCSLSEHENHAACAGRVERQRRQVDCAIEERPGVSLLGKSGTISSSIIPCRQPHA